MPLKIIGTGLGRTGTYSLKLALEHLGFGNCYHMTELFQKPEGVKFFRQAEKGFEVNWDDLFGNYVSAVDYPVARYFRQITDYYKDAKVIHTYRDPHKWYESASRTIFMANRLPFKRLIKFAVHFPVKKEVRKRFPVLMYNRNLMKLEFGKDLTDRKYIIQKFERHTENVVKHFSSERLLLFNAAEGWEPLCRFLGVKIPSENFPYSNTFSEFMDKVEIIGTGKFLPQQKLY